MIGRRDRGLTVLVVGLVVADQAVKAWVRANLALYDSISVIPGLFNLTRVHNTGAAFGVLNSVEFPFKAMVLATVATVALIGVAFYASALPVSQRVARVGLACIIGGAAGNLIDRVTAGYVLDFVDVYWNSWHFWAFNVADASITAGAGLLVLDMIGVGRPHVSRTV